MNAARDLPFDKGPQRRLVDSARDRERRYQRSATTPETLRSHSVNLRGPQCSDTRQRALSPRRQIQNVAHGEDTLLSDQPFSGGEGAFRKNASITRDMGQ